MQNTICDARGVEYRITNRRISNIERGRWVWHFRMPGATPFFCLKYCWRHCWRRVPLAQGSNPVTAICRVLPDFDRSSGWNPRDSRHGVGTPRQRVSSRNAPFDIRYSIFVCSIFVIRHSSAASARCARLFARLCLKTSRLQCGWFCCRGPWRWF
jgi:hypothetical protein